MSSRTTKQVKNKEANTPSLDSYNFKTSGYVMMKSGTRRDHDTGRLIPRSSSKKPVTA